VLSQIESDFPINDEPGHGISGDHLGSAFDVAFYGIVQKDLRSILHLRVRGPQFRAIGAITQPLIEWVNRPTFQQADQIIGHAHG
jgi:hypothetical protein